MDDRDRGPPRSGDPTGVRAPRSAFVRPLYQLTLMRLRELTREPGVLFWIFGFPLLISVGLGMAFRTRAPEPVAVGALPGAPAEVVSALERGGVQVRPVDEATARLALRSG